MKCPSCGAEQAQASAECALCGLTLKALDERFGFVPRHRATVTDLGQILTLNEVTKIERRVTAFSRNFPGVSFAVILTKLPATRNPSEYCFWLMNRGNFAQSDAKLERNRTILLLLDAEGPSASLMVGYGLEHVLSEEDLRGAMESVTPALRRGDLFGAAQAAIRAVGPVLKRNIVALKGKVKIIPAAGGETVAPMESVSRISS